MDNSLPSQSAGTDPPQRVSPTTYLSDGFKVIETTEFDWRDLSMRIQILRQGLDRGWLWVATSRFPPPRHWTPIGQALALNMMDDRANPHSVYEETVSQLHPVYSTNLIDFIPGEPPRPDWDHPDEAPIQRSSEFWKLRKVLEYAEVLEGGEDWTRHYIGEHLRQLVLRSEVMSDFMAKVVRIRDIQPHPNADALEFAYVEGYPIIVRKGEYSPGDLASYIPLDAVLPSPEHELEFESVFKYTSKGRVRAARLRGEVSHGLLWRVPATFEVGDDIAAYWGILKYDDSSPSGTQFLPADAEPDPKLMPKYDVENIRHWSSVLTPGETVVITEKLHGTNARFLHDGDRLWVGSRNQMLKPDSDSLWARVARDYKLEEKLAFFPEIAIYGEIIGVQDLMYGLKPGSVKLYLFDAYLVKHGSWYGWVDMEYLSSYLNVPLVPVLFRGPWDEDLLSLADGNSLLYPTQIREGVVIKPIVNRYYGALGRVLLKHVSDSYLLRKEAA